MGRTEHTAVDTDRTSRITPLRRAGYERILRGVLILTLPLFLYACAGLYPALYRRPAAQDRTGAVLRDSEPMDAGSATASASEQTQAEQTRTLTVATLNMLHGLPRFEYLDSRKQLILEELRRLAPDVVLLQEVPVFRNREEQIGPWLAQGLGYGIAYGRANGRALLGFEEGEAVLSRYPIR